MEVIFLETYLLRRHAGSAKFTLYELISIANEW